MLPDAPIVVQEVLVTKTLHCISELSIADLHKNIMGVLTIKAAKLLNCLV